MRLHAGRPAGAYTEPAVKPHRKQSSAPSGPWLRRCARRWTAGLLLPVFIGATSAQTANPLPPQQPAPTQAAQAPSAPSAASRDSQKAVAATTPAQDAQLAEPSRASDRRRAAKLYRQASKLFEKES